MQLDEAHRGFSFQADGNLDMRMNPRQGVTAEQVVNQFGEKELADLIYEFGEERRSRRIARAIVRARPITTTAELARVVSGCAPPMKRERGKHVIHPATRTFQALRIYVNGELDELKALLESAPKLAEAGRKAGDDQLSFAGRPAGERCVSRGRAGRDLRSSYPEAADRGAG